MLRLSMHRTIGVKCSFCTSLALFCRYNFYENTHRFFRSFARHCRLTVFVCMRAWRLWLKCMDRNEMDEKWKKRLPCFSTETSVGLIEIKMRAHVFCVIISSECLASPHSRVNYFRKCQLEPRNNITVAHNCSAYFFPTWHPSEFCFRLKNFVHFIFVLESFTVCEVLKTNFKMVQKCTWLIGNWNMDFCLFL